MPVWRLSDEAGGIVAWADSGKMITWALGNTFHRLPFAAAIEFVQQQKAKAASDEAQGGSQER